MQLEVPVGLYPTQSSELLVVGGGSHSRIPFPVPVFEYRESDTVELGTEMKLIGGGKIRVWKDTYPTIPMTGRADKSNVPRIDYVLELVKDHPDIITSLVTPFEPYPMFADIETESTTGKFSRPEYDEIISIQVKFPDTDPFLLMATDGKSETDILIQFMKYCIESPTHMAPDFVCGYNINRFDAPYVKERIKRCARASTELYDLVRRAYRFDGTMYYPSWINNAAKQKTTIDIVPGLPTLDIYLHAKMDLTLTTLPSRTLENVAKAYGAAHVVEIDAALKKDMRGMMENDRELFAAYALDDVIQTEYLYNIYSQRLIASSNLLTCPMMMIHHASSGQKSYIALYRECRRHGYHSVKKNKDRYDYLYDRAPQYQGAIVKCFQTGYFDKSVYIDAKSLYPNIIHDYNISFDRYQLLSVLDYDGSTSPVDGDGFWPDEAARIGLDDITPRMLVNQEGDQTILYVPDDNYQCVLKYSIDFVNDGFMRGLINHYNGVRDRFKSMAAAAQKQYKETQDDHARIESIMYDSMQMEAKVLNNTFYGVLAQRYYEVADLPAAILVTAIGRWIMEQMIDLIGGAVIEVDTDGVLLDRTRFDMDLDEVNRIIRERQVQFFGVPADKMQFRLEFEGAGSVYMYKQKNYILRKDGASKLTTKGSSFTGYDKAPVILRAVKIMSESTMSFGDYGHLSYQEAYDLATDVMNLPQESFKFTKTLRKEPSDYKGYEGISSYVSNFSYEQKGEAKLLRAMSSRALSYIRQFLTKRSGVTSHEIASYRQLIRDAETVGQLEIVLAVLNGVDSPKQQNRHFILDLILRMKRDGYNVEPDDTIEYYYALDSTQYLLAHELTDISLIDYMRYVREIGKICERFRLADPVIDDMDLGLM